MDFFNVQDSIEFIALGVVLAIVHLILVQWQPPIEKQLKALILLVIGTFLGQYVCDSYVGGFMLSGLVFYKNDLVQEFSMVKSSLKDIKEVSNKTKVEEK